MTNSRRKTSSKPGGLLTFVKKVFVPTEEELKTYQAKHQYDLI